MNPPEELNAATLHIHIAKLEADRSEALIILESLLPICWSEDWDSDDVRNKLEWAIKFCGGKVSNPTPQPVEFMAGDKSVPVE